MAYTITLFILVGVLATVNIWLASELKNINATMKRMQNELQFVYTNTNKKYEENKRKVEAEQQCRLRDMHEAQNRLIRLETIAGVTTGNTERRKENATGFNDKRVEDETSSAAVH